MAPRFQKFAAALLLCTWPMAMCLAMFWHDHHNHEHQHEHDHSHQQAATTVAAGECEDHHHDHSHAHDHQPHAHHHHDEVDAGEEFPPRFPHRHENGCGSCELLSLPVILAERVVAEFDEYLTFRELPLLESLTSATVPGDSHLRGPPLPTIA